MDHQSIVEPNPAALDGSITPISPARTPPGSVSAKIAAANTHPPVPPAPRFPGEDAGRSLAAMACRDLDAALQLLAERAQYITGASGAMIALRRGEHNDMLCRASAGPNAPELGALLSMEYGFSGESVRTRQALRCDDADHDPRVNREGCRQLGIASVVVMPILSDQQVLGVFELFSGKARAFEERDLSALTRLSEMVETAVKYAVAAQSVPGAQDGLTPSESRPLADEVKVAIAAAADPVTPANSDLLAPAAKDLPLPAPLTTESQVPGHSPTEVVPAEPNKSEPKTSEPAPGKPLFWSAATPASSDGGPTSQANESAALPAVLRNLHKCQACGFPVSQGRKYCVECEEKQWRGEPLPKVPSNPAKPVQSPASRGIDHTPKSSVVKQASANNSSPTRPVAVRKDTTTGAATPAVVVTTAASDLAHSLPVKSAANATHISSASSSHIAEPGQTKSISKPERISAPDNSTLFLSAAGTSESWLAANKYIFIALILVAIIIAAIALLH